MSQKKLKKLRRKEILNKQSDVPEIIVGVREIIKKNWKFLVLLVIGIFVLYFNSLWGDFVSDDYASITQNPAVKSIAAAWSASFFPNFYKSLIAIVFGISSPIPFHVFNLLIYILICILAFIFLNLFFDGLISKMAIVLFAVLPIHVEAVSWISGEPYLLVAFLILSSLINLVLWFRTKNKKYLLTFIFLSLILVFTDRIRGFGLVLLLGLIFVSFREKIKVKLKLSTVLLIILTIFGVLMVVAWSMINNRIESVNGGINASDSIFYNPVFQYPTAIAKYLQLAWFPADLTLYHTMYIIPAWLNWLILITYTTSLVWFFVKNKKIFFALAFIFTATVPSMAPVKVSWLVAERYLFLGSLGFCLLISIYLEKIFIKNKLLSLGLLTILVSIYGLRVFLRNIDWRTNHNLWVVTCQVSPNSHNAWNNIGDDYDKLGQYENAVKGFTQSTIVKPNYADAFHNRANIFYKMGRLDLARDSYQTAVNFNPAMYQTYLSLIQIDLTEKKADLALEHLTALQNLKPNDLQVGYVSAVVYAQVGQKDNAKLVLNQILKVYPNFSQARQLLKELSE